MLAIINSIAERVLRSGLAWPRAPKIVELPRPCQLHITSRWIQFLQLKGESVTDAMYPASLLNVYNGNFTKAVPGS